MARLARETHLPFRTIEALHRIVRPGERRTGPGPATADEKAEYAIALAILGLTSEVKSLLADVDVARCPRAADALTTACFSEWDYTRALEVARAARQSKARMKDSERLELAWNHATALLFAPDEYYRGGNFRECRRIFGEILRETGDSAFPYLRRLTLRNVAI